MKPDFEKIADEIVYDDDIETEYRHGGERHNTVDRAYLASVIIKSLESAYLAGRKAQVKVDAEIAMSFSDNPTVNKSIVIAKAIESQEIKP